MNCSTGYSIKNQIRQFPLAFKCAKYVYTKIRGHNIRRVSHWLVSGHVIKYFRIRKWLHLSQQKYLQIGGGRHLKKGNCWLNGDIIAGEIYLNAGKKLPFPDDSVDVLFTEQFIEHLSQEQAVFFLKEAYRILKVGGIVRQSTPDLGALIALYEDKNSKVSLSTAVARHMRNHRRNDNYSEATGCQFINDMSRLWGHQFIYDKHALKTVSENIGFKNFKWVLFGESEKEGLRNLERHADEEWMKSGFVMLAEATK